MIQLSEINRDKTAMPWRITHHPTSKKQMET
jgi:hypothetical protein